MSMCSCPQIYYIKCLECLFKNYAVFSAFEVIYWNFVTSNYYGGLHECMYFGKYHTKKNPLSHPYQPKCYSRQPSLLTFTTG